MPPALDAKKETLLKGTKQSRSTAAQTAAILLMGLADPDLSISEFIAGEAQQAEGTPAPRPGPSRLRGLADPLETVDRIRRKETGSPAQTTSE